MTGRIGPRVARLEQRAGMKDRPPLILLTEDRETYQGSGGPYTRTDLPELGERHTLYILVGIDPDGKPEGGP
jgi:hypothetical protein